MNDVVVARYIELVKALGSAHGRVCLQHVSPEESGELAASFSYSNAQSADEPVLLTMLLASK